MSTCPSKNVHSLYIDGELPQPYKNSFETHLSQCEKCRKQQKMYLSIDAGLHDSVFEQDLENGYLRLQARLRYKEIIDPIKSSSLGSYILKASPLMAAALILAIFLPLNLSYTNTKNDSLLANNAMRTNLSVPNNSIQVAPLQQQGIVVGGNLPQAKNASLMGANPAINIIAPKLTEIDVFMPELPKNTVQIQITLFSVSDMPLESSDDLGFSQSAERIH